MAFGGSSRGLNVFVNIGGNLLPSLGSTATAVEKRFGLMGTRLRRQATEMKATMRGIASAMKPLAGLALAGGLDMGLKGMLGEGAEYQHQIIAMRMMGRSVREVADSVAAANRTIRDVPTASLNDSLKILNETTLAFGGLGHAMENLTFNSKMGALMKGIMGDGYDEAGGFNQLVRALELRSGKMKAADYQRQASNLFKAIVVSGGTVNPEEFLGFMQQAGVAARGYNENFLTRVAPSLIQEFGGQRAGTAATALFNQFMGRVAVGGKSITQEWVRLGLVPPKGTGGNLSATGWSPGSLKNNSLAMADPLAYVEQVIFPALKAHGVDLNNRQAMILQAQKMFGRETGKRLASTFFDPAQLARIHADQNLYDKASGVDKAYSQALYNDPRMAQMAAANSLKNMETMLGKSVWGNPAVTHAIITLAQGFNSLAGVFDRHPNFAKGIVAFTGLSAVAATLTVFGIGLRLIAGPFKLFGKLFMWAGGLAARLGPLLIRGLAALAPDIMEGLGLAFYFLSTPAGWATLLGLAVVGLAVWFRGPLMRAWQNGWNALKSWVLSVNWASIGMSIANALTFGLAGKFASAIAHIKGSVPNAGGNVGMNSAHGGLTGMRAGGGFVRRGGLYMVGERGRELFSPDSNGHIIPNHHIRALARRHGANPYARGSFGPVTINVNGAQDPQAVAREVHRELNRLANKQAALLSD